MTSYIHYHVLKELSVTSVVTGIIVSCTILHSQSFAAIGRTEITENKANWTLHLFSNW